MGPATSALLASGLAAAVTTIGIVVIERYRSWGTRNVDYFSSFAAGVLISAALLHLLPESFGRAARAPLFVLAGYFALHLVDRFLAEYVCDKPDGVDYRMGLVPLLGIGLHSFVDGVVYAVTFQVSTFTGTLTAVGLVLHEFPEGIVTFLLLVDSGVRVRTAALGAFLAAALTTPLGALVALPWVDRLDDRLLGQLLALSGGALIYVGATHLLPHATRSRRRFSLLALAAGVGVALSIVLVEG